MSIRKDRALLPYSVGALALSLGVAILLHAEPEPESDRTKVATSQSLGGVERYLAHVSTDKPIYREGDKVYVRGVLLNANSRVPLPDNQRPNGMVTIVGPKGDTITSGWVAGADSTIGFAWEVPADQPGGEYIAKLSFPNDGHAPAERKFEIRKYAPPRLRTQIEFLRDGYGPADEVVGTLEVKRAEGGIPAGAPVTIVGRVDGEEVFRGNSTVNEEGRAQARFQLPAQMTRGEGTLAMIIEDGGVVETATKTIPILLQTVDLQLYPEGGDIIAGLQNRVYFEAFTPAKKPADLAGIIVDDNEQEVAKFRSEHEGRGRFEFTPKPNERYWLKIAEPAGINTLYPLPKVLNKGVVISSEADQFASEAPVKLTVTTTDARKLRVSLSQREVELSSVHIDAKPAEDNEVIFNPAANIGGVLTATVWNQNGTPLAERLIFRKPSKNIRVKITPDLQQYIPGGTAKLKIETTDQSGAPISSVVGITVTDDSVLEMIETREQRPRLPAMALLENEVKELADANVYLDSDNKLSPVATDLLLGTQGWRRFSLVDAAGFLAKHGDDGRRALAVKIITKKDVEERKLLFRFGVRRGGAFPPVPAAPAEADAFFDQADGDGAQIIDAIAEDAAEAEKPQALPKLEAVAPGRPDQRQALDTDRAKQRVQGQAAELRKALDFADKEVLADRLLKQEESNKKIQAFAVVRVYAHEIRPNRKAGERIDFTETLYWNSAIRTDTEGKAEIEFDLNDSVTSFKVAADAFAQDGALGAASIDIESVEPFYVEPKLPLEVTSGDEIHIPISLVNATGMPFEEVRLSAKANIPELIDVDLAAFPIDANSRIRKLLRLRAGNFAGDSDITLSAKTSAYTDSVTRRIKVTPAGFPIEFGRGGLLEPNGSYSTTVTIPDNVVPQSMMCRVLVYPTPLASMNEALARLIREPCGCFEQTSSSTYPLIMAQQYFMSHQGVDPSLIERSSDLLSKGYDRLIGFESKSGGYEWFGNDPGHDALTAYGLLEFTDMSQVRDVDSAMIERTRKWLLDQRDGNGAFERKTNTLHTWLADAEVSTAYNVWALLESGTNADEMPKEIEFVLKNGERSENAYAVALAANVLALAGENDDAARLMKLLADFQGLAKDGSVEGATQSVVGSGGESLKIEATALAMLAWMQNPTFAPNVEEAKTYLAEVCKGGRFGSTQSTILALRAIVAYDKLRAKPKAPGSLVLLVDGKPVGANVKFDKDTTGAIELPEITKLMTAGDHKISIKMADGSQMPFSISVEYNSVQPASAKECQIGLDVHLRDTKLREGDVTEAEVIVNNLADETVANPVAIIGIPAGFEVRHDQLKELVKEERIAAYEVLGREVVLYWRALRSEETVELPISLIASSPGIYTAPASRSYLYYTDEHKSWVPALRAEISAREAK